MPAATLASYEHWLLHPDAPDAEPFNFADEFVLSMVTDALAHGMRELAYDRHGFNGHTPPGDGDA